MATVITLNPGANATTVTQHLRELGVWSAALHDNAGAVTALTLSNHSAAISADALQRVPGVAQVLSDEAALRGTDGPAKVAEWRRTGQLNSADADADA